MKVPCPRGYSGVSVSTTSAKRCGRSRISTTAHVRASESPGRIPRSGNHVRLVSSLNKPSDWQIAQCDSPMRQSKLHSRFLAQSLDCQTVKGEHANHS